MLDSEYVKVYDGNFIIINRIKTELNAIGINPIIKDESESYRLSGIAPSIQGFQEVFVHEDELDKVTTIIERIKTEMTA